MKSGRIHDSSIFTAFADTAAEQRERFIHAEPTPTPQPARRESPGKKQSIIYPLCLHTLGEQAPRVIAAYTTEQRIEYLTLVSPDFDTDVDADEHRKQIMATMNVHTVDAYWKLVEQAERTVTDYQIITGEKSLPMVRVNTDVLTDTLHGDLSVFHFLVYGAIRSALDYHNAPWNITTATIERRVLGFTSRKSYDAGYQVFYPVPVTITRDRIRRATRQLAKRGFIERFTLGRWTWYATRPLLTKLGIKSLEQHALNVCLKNRQREQKVTERQSEVRRIYADEILRLKRRTPKRHRQDTATPTPFAAASPVAPAVLPVKLYDREQIPDTNLIRHRCITDSGQVQFAIQILTDETQKQLREMGYTVEHYR